MVPRYSWSLRTVMEQDNETLRRRSRECPWIPPFRLHGWSEIRQAKRPGDAKLQRGGRAKRWRRMEGRTTGRRPYSRKVVGAVWRCNVERDRRSGGLIQPKPEDRRGESTPSAGSDSLQSRRASADHWKLSRHLRHSSFR